MKYLLSLLLVLTISPAAMAERYLLDFTATWCGPCQHQKPMLEQLRKEGLKIVEVDVDKRPDLRDHFKVTTVPTYVMIDGYPNETGRVVNATTAEELRRLYVRPILTTTMNNLRSALCPFVNFFQQLR